MISIGIDVSNIDYDNLTGIGNYAKYLTLALTQLDQTKVIGSYRLSRLKNIGSIRKHLPKTSLSPFVPGISNYLSNQYDVFHGPDYKIPKITKSKKVVTIHDMAYMNTDFSTEDFLAWGKKRMERVLFKAKPDSIITVSDFSRNEFLSEYPQYENITRTVHLGSDHHKSVPFHSKVYDFPYVLFVGSLEKRKNLHGVIDAFELYHKENHSDIHLVIAGGRGNSPQWSDYLVERINGSRNKKMIHHLGYSESGILDSLYEHAVCLAFPSLYEGFGIPILEAMHHGCPVITSNQGAMKEIAKTSALLVDPTNQEEIADAILRIQDETLRLKLITEGFLNVKTYTWKKCAAETLSLYQSLV
jgi:glycosyltransferase involved in cell wall biosynthesis